MYMTETSIAVAVVIVVAWLTVRWREWRRIPNGERTPLGERLRTVMRAEWPLLAILLLPAVLPLLADRSLRTLLLGLAVVLVWWTGEAVGYIGSRATPARDPLVCSIAAVRRLGRSPWLVGLLLAVWFGSWATGVQQVRVWRAQATQQSLPEQAGEQPVLAGPGASGPGVSLPEPGVMTAERALRETAEGLVYQLPGYGQVVWAGTAVLLVMLGAVILFGRTAFGGAPDERERAAWPFRLTVFLFLVSAVPLLVWLRGNAFTNLNTWPASLWGLLMSLAFLSAGPYDALLWNVWRQVAEGKRWDIARAIDGAVRTWVPFVGLIIVSVLPSIVLMDVINLLTSITPSTLPAASVGFAVHSTTTSLLATLMPLFGLALAFVPWLIVDERIGVRMALVRSWALARDNATDLLTFALRFLVLYGAVDFLRMWQDRSAIFDDYSIATAAYSLSGFIERLIAVLAIGVLYQHLRGARTGVSVPPTDMTEAP